MSFYHGDCFDDMAPSITGIKLGLSGVSAATVDDTAPANPATGYPGTLLFSDSTVQYAAQVYQVPHDWKIGTDLTLHVHWAKTTSAAGTVLWEAQWASAPAMSGVAGDFQGSYQSASSVVSDTDTAEYVALDSWTISGSGLGISQLISVAFRRNGGTYAAPVRLWAADIHYQRDGLGSRTATAK